MIAAEVMSDSLMQEGADWKGQTFSTRITCWNERYCTFYSKKQILQLFIVFFAFFNPDYTSSKVWKLADGMVLNDTTVLQTFERNSLCMEAFILATWKTSLAEIKRFIIVCTMYF